MSKSLQLPGLQPTRLLCPRDFPGKNTGVGFHFLLQGIFLTQGSNPHLLHLLHWQVDSSSLCHLGSPGNRSWLVDGSGESFFLVLPHLSIYKIRKQKHTTPEKKIRTVGRVKNNQLEKHGNLWPSGTGANIFAQTTAFQVPC